MIHRDLGRLSGDVLVFGGPVSNLQATEALIAEAARRGIPPERCLCTGDLAAYCADPAATVAAIRRFGCPVVAGNCERQLAASAETCGCGFAPGTACHRLSARWYAHCDAAIGADDRAWMAGLPELITFEAHGRRVAAVHGGLTDIARYLWPVSPEADFAAELAAIRAAAGAVDRVVAGHSGIAFEREVAGGLWLNAGSIGLPPHDGRPQTRFAVLAEDGARICRLDYDHAAAAEAMARAGLTQGYDRTLATGVWPSEDVLPRALRR